MNTLTFHGSAPGIWVCEVIVEDGSRFWIACYNGVVSAFTFGSAATATREVEMMRTAAEGRRIDLLANEVAPWRMEQDFELTRGPRWQVWRAVDRFEAVRASPMSDPIFIMVDPDAGRGVVFRDEGDLFAVERKFSG